MKLVAPLEPPTNPIAAATHPDPYPYYAQLVAERPFFRDGSTDVWIASSASAVTAVLKHPAGCVRPAAEPVPSAIVGCPAGDFFGRLVRMTDGGAHAPLKDAVATSLARIDSVQLRATAQQSASRLAEGMDAGVDASRITEFAFALSVHTIATLTGFRPTQLDTMMQLIRELVKCVFTAATRGEIETGNEAMNQLHDLFCAQLAGTSRSGSRSLLRNLANDMHRDGIDNTDIVVANAVGFLTQAYDATAGLINTTLLTLARNPELVGHHALRSGTIAEVLRFDSPVQNTRRFFSETVVIEGERLAPGDSVLVLLGAANRDPRANAEPHWFNPSRADARVFTFGLGVHECPARMLAASIAQAGIERLLADGLDPSRLNKRPAYRPSLNTRTPLLTWATD